jgi:hypothetical protein
MERPGRDMLLAIVAITVVCIGIAVAIIMVEARANWATIVNVLLGILFLGMGVCVAVGYWVYKD